MKPMRNIFEPESRRGVGRAGVLLASMALAVLSGFAAVAQEPHLVASTNTPSATNALVEAVKSGSVEAGAATNTAAVTNEVLPTNSPVIANSIAPTNEAASTNAAAETNAVSLPSRPASTAGGSGRLDFASFKILTDRNIFDPNRSPRRQRDERREYRRPTRIDSFALVGTMSYEKGQFAFFDGSSYEFRKVLKPADTIAGYKLAEVGHNEVKLATGTNCVELRMGMQMRRVDDGEWSLSMRSESSSSFSPTTAASAPSAAAGTNAEPGVVAANAEAAPAATAPAAASADENEILKRLMQRREQEMNK
ncbi:MAG: hypothetical protein HZA90_26115 [Verrucomicrobia bacterium]|nr:hypothetical protein [Verrucomicrobiota bacterium]